MEHIFCIFLFIRVYAHALHPQVPKTIRSTRLNMFNQVVTNVSVFCNVCFNQTKMIVNEFQDPKMPLSRAEIQKRYREKKKATEGEAYLARERARQKSNYVPADLLTRSARKRRNDNIKERVRKHRLHRKISASRNEDADGNDTTE